MKSAIPPPPGQESNFDAKASIAPTYYGISGILMTVMLVAKVLRTCGKILLVRRFQWVDVTITLGFLGAIFYFIVVTLCLTIADFGKHYWDVPASMVESRTFLILAYCADAWPPLIFYFIRISFILLYLEVFGPFKWAQIICWIIFGLMSCFYLPFFIVHMYETTPKHGQTWQEGFADPMFVSSVKLAIPLASVNIAFDVLIFIFPLIAVSQLAMSRTRKLEVSLVFSTASIAIVASILSLIYRIKAGATTDVTYSAFPVQFTSFIEMDVGVTVFCMPTISSLYHYWFQRKYANQHIIEPYRQEAAGC